MQNQDDVNPTLLFLKQKFLEIIEAPIAPYSILTIGLFCSFYIRHSSQARGMPFIHSLALTMTLALSPLYTFQFMIGEQFQMYPIYITIIAWCLMNIFPFDAIFRFFQEKWISIPFKIAFSIAQALMFINFLRVKYVPVLAGLAMCVPIAVDLLDREFYHDSAASRKGMSIFCTSFSQRILLSCIIFSFSSLIKDDAYIGVLIIITMFGIADVTSYRSPFGNIDIIFFLIQTKQITYHGGRKPTQTNKPKAE